MNLKTQYMEGRAGQACPYLWSSASWTAWHAGRALRASGEPRKVTSARGQAVRVDGVLYRVNDRGEVRP